MPPTADRPVPDTLPPLSPQAQQLLDRFEALWHQGLRPVLAEFAAACPAAELPRVLADLAHAELEFRLQAGEDVHADDYLQLYPKLADRADVADALRAAEERLRHRFGAADQLAAPMEVGSAGNNQHGGCAGGPEVGRFPVVPGYEILDELGRGGMGIVYRAQQLKLGRAVALKMILSGVHAEEAELARFRTESEAIARLQHPNIVQVFEVGEQGGRPYFSLEFCAGGSLHRKLAGTPLPPNEAAALVEMLARAMTAAHQKGIVHRDLKPANVLFALDGTPKVTDFGLAKKLDEVGQTATGEVMGTPCYMAPEQASGLGKRVGPSADVYALGAILYECLTGRPPFLAATALETILQVVNEDPVPVRNLQPDTPRDLETVCLKCLEKKPQNRYAEADDLAEDLRRFLHNEPIQARAVGFYERISKYIQRRPATAIVVVLVLYIAVALLGLKDTGLLAASTGLAFVGILPTVLYRLIRKREREANERLQTARRIVDEIYTVAARMGRNDAPAPGATVRTFLIKTQDLYEILIQDEDEGAESRWMGLAHFRIGQVFHKVLGNWLEAARSYNRAISVQERLCRHYPAVAAYGDDLANSLRARAVLLRERGIRLQEAEPDEGPFLESCAPILVEEGDEPLGVQGYLSREGRTVVVFTGSPNEAGLVRSFLESHGIVAHLACEVIAVAAPMLAAAGGVGGARVFVAAEQAERARGFIMDRMVMDFEYPC